MVEPEPTSTILPSHLRRSRRHREGATSAGGFRTTAATSAVVDLAGQHHRQPTPEQIDREEMSALRHLASELHAALRLSEEENLLLKGVDLIISPLKSFIPIS